MMVWWSASLGLEMRGGDEGGMGGKVVVDCVVCNIGKEEWLHETVIMYEPSVIVHA